MSLNQFPDKDEKMYGLNGSPTRVLRIFSLEANTDRETWRGSSDELSQKLARKLQELKFV
ncbi:hypothetical protein SDC9_179554 [bioreactor metagenome]|uniref:Uncharacterized protein n=1 Tax=bioreactor metagenome TaxID=1076179 RepID=A0A645GZB3_9ZZZZ